jgi:hypothetical protein
METLLDTREILFMKDRELTPAEIGRRRDLIEFEQNFGFQTRSWVRVAVKLQLPFRSVAREATKMVIESGTPATSSSASPAISSLPPSNPRATPEVVPVGIPQPPPKACVSDEITTSPKQNDKETSVPNDTQQTQDGVIIIHDDDDDKSNYTMTQIKRWKRDTQLYTELEIQLNTMQTDYECKMLEFELLTNTCNRLKAEVKQIRTNYDSKVNELDQLQEAYDRLEVKYETDMSERDAKPPDSDEITAGKLQVTSLFIVSSGIP